MSNPFISICIPAYKRIEFLKRLLDSIAIQEYKDFEVIVTDDSPSDEAGLLCDNYKGLFTLGYYKNSTPLGPPENWNEGLRNAKGEWIKIMHDDDWFVDAKSLAHFATAAKNNPDSFIFSSYTNVYFPEERMETVNPTAIRLRQLKKDPVSLLSKNSVGPPSTILHKNDQQFFYDKNIKWLVDIEYYIQRLSVETAVHIDRNLVNVGLGVEQVTASCHTNPNVEIPENLYFLQKTGTKHLKNIIVYDAWWRLLRNFNIKDQAHLEQYAAGPWPEIILLILKDVNMVPKSFIKIGAVSKLMMTLSYLKNKRRIQ